MLHQPSFLELYSGTSIVIVSVVCCYYLHHEQDDALTTSAKMALANAALCLVFSWPTADYSWVDRLWSVVPCFYSIHFASASAWEPRTTLMAVLSTIWGIRLSFNFNRKAGY